MAKPSFRRQAIGLLRPRLAVWGFTHLEGPYFARDHEGWSDLLWPDLLIHNPGAFTLSYGLYFPKVNAAVSAITGDRLAPGLAVNGDTKGQRFYFFAPPRSLEVACEQALADLEAQALPWFGGFAAAADAVAAFQSQRILPRLGKTPDPRGWFVYGLLLEDLGRNREAQDWFRRAREELGRPWYSKSGKLLRDKVPGARTIAPDPFDQALLRSLEERAEDTNEPGGAA